MKRGQLGNNGTGKDNDARAEAQAAAALAANARQMVLNRDPRLTAVEQNTADLKALSDNYQAALGTSVADRAALHAADTDMLTRIAALEARPLGVQTIATGVGRLPVALLIGGNTDVTVTLSRTMPNTTYKVELPTITGMTLTVKSKTTTSCVVTVTAGLALALGTQFQLVAWN